MKLYMVPSQERTSPSNILRVATYNSQVTDLAEKPVMSFVDHLIISI
jgi:hypothetical protein